MLLSLTSLLSGCQECPLVGCGPAVELSIESTDPSFGVDTVFVELAFDDEVYVAQCNPQTACEVEGVKTGHPIRGQMVGGLIDLEVGSGADAPETIEVRVSAHDEVLLEEVITPDYDTRDRAGDDACGTCSSAEAPIELLVEA